jgi:hypothetical protein
VYDFFFLYYIQLFYIIFKIVNTENRENLFFEIFHISTPKQTREPETKLEKIK